MFIIFFTFLSLPFANFQALENIFKKKDEGMINMQLNDIPSFASRYSQLIKQDNSKIISFIQDDLPNNQKKRQTVQKPSNNANNKRRVRRQEKKAKKKTLVRRATTNKPKTLKPSTKKKLTRRTTTNKPKTLKPSTKKKLTKRTTTNEPETTTAVDVYAEFKEEIINNINEQRRINHADPLQLNATIAKEAQNFTDKVIRENLYPTVYDGPLGQIFFISNPKNVGDPRITWLSDIENYNFDNHSNREHFSDFTQIIWKNTKQIGCGVTEYASAHLLVCRFYPKGNIEGEYPENVLRPN